MSYKANNRITVFQNNTKNIACAICSVGNIDGSFGGYNPYITVKDKADGTTVLNKLGVIDSSTTCMFYLLPSDTSLAAKDYVYDITLEGYSNVYTVVKDRFSVLDGVRY